MVHYEATHPAFCFSLFKSCILTDIQFYTVPAHFRSKNFNQSGIVGHSVTLACEAEGDFPIRITWSSFANSAISSKETSTSLISELRLDRLNRQNAGIYRCTASNSFGYDHMAIHLSVKGNLNSK